MAAGAAVYAAAEAPELIARLVLISPVVRDLESGGLLPKLFPILLADGWGSALWRRYYASLYPARHPDDFDAYLSRLQANLREPGRMASLRKMIAASKAASGERLAHIKQPALVIMGSRDPDFKSFPDEPRWVADQLHGTYRSIAGAGHYPHAEMPDSVAPIIISFLQSVSVVMPHGA